MRRRRASGTAPDPKASHFLPLLHTQLSLPQFPEGLPQGPLSLRLLLFAAPQRLRNVPPSRSFVGYRLKKATTRNIRSPLPRSFPLRFSHGPSPHVFQERLPCASTCVSEPFGHEPGSIQGVRGVPRFLFPTAHETFDKVSEGGSFATATH